MTYMTHSGFGGNSYFSNSANYKPSTPQFSVNNLENLVSPAYKLNFSSRQSYEGNSLSPGYVINLDKKLEVISEPKRDYSSINQSYSKNSTDLSNYQKHVNSVSFESPFLNKERPLTTFISKAQDIESYVREAFEKVTNEEFPKNIAIKVLSLEDFKDELVSNNARFSSGIMGFAINNNKTGGQNFIVLKENSLDILLLTAGHEIGHVFTEQLDHQVNEEAKAFSFEIAWARIIKENNIAGLKDSINSDLFSPAINGIHNIAFDFVKNMLKDRIDALSLYFDIAKRVIIPLNPMVVDSY